MNTTKFHKQSFMNIYSFYVQIADSINIALDLFYMEI
jgi:hypothetical protein